MTSQLPTRLPPLTLIAQTQALQTWSQEAGTDRVWAPHAAERRLYEVHGAWMHSCHFMQDSHIIDQQTQTLVCFQEEP